MRKILAALLLLGLALVAYGYLEATRAPRVVTYAVAPPGWDGPPLRIAHLSDTHAAKPDMPPERLRAIVDRVNALKPDLIMLTGDYVSGRVLRTGSVALEDAILPLRGLKARYGVFAVLGNHDHEDADPEAAARLFRRAGITLLRNAAVRANGFWVAGVDDLGTGHTDLGSTLKPVPDGAPVLLLSHNPDVFPQVPPRVALTFAGHTHGGQIAPPGIGPILTPSSYGLRFARGHIVEDGRHMIVSSGLGASGVPLRIGVPPEIVLVRLRPGARR